MYFYLDELSKSRSLKICIFLLSDFIQVLEKIENTFLRYYNNTWTEVTLSGGNPIDVEWDKTLFNPFAVDNIALHDKNKGIGILRKFAAFMFWNFSS